jgi:hypothetical protein
LLAPPDDTQHAAAMSTALLEAPPAPLKLEVLALHRVTPDTERAYRVYGVAMVETFDLPLPDGGVGRCWIPTAEAMAIGGFGRGWIASALAMRADQIGQHELIEQLAARPALRLCAADVG